MQNLISKLFNYLMEFEPQHLGTFCTFAKLEITSTQDIENYFAKAKTEEQLFIGYNLCTDWDDIHQGTDSDEYNKLPISQYIIGLYAICDNLSKNL